MPTYRNGTPLPLGFTMEYQESDTASEVSTLPGSHLAREERQIQVEEWLKATNPDYEFYDEDNDRETCDPMWGPGRDPYTERSYVEDINSNS